MRVMIERRWRHWPAMLALTWFGVDGCYAAYWSAVNPTALELMRDANAPASLSLFWTVGLLWMYRGSLSEMTKSVRAGARQFLLRGRRLSQPLTRGAEEPGQ